jgi:hypothetical protein
MVAVRWPKHTHCKQFTNLLLEDHAVLTEQNKNFNQWQISSMGEKSSLVHTPSKACDLVHMEDLTQWSNEVLIGLLECKKKISCSCVYVPEGFTGIIHDRPVHSNQELSNHKKIGTRSHF